MLQTIILTILIGGIFTLVFGGVGIFMLNRYREARREAKESKDWLSTSGLISFSDISTITPTREVDITRSPTYAPVVEYTYTVQGIAYRGKRIGFGTVISSTRTEAASIIERYPVGTVVNVYYDPHNPAEAVLEQKVGSQTGFLVLICICILLGICACSGSIWVIINSLLNPK